MNLIGTILVYAGFLAFFLGLVSVAWPLKFLWIATRARGLLVLAGGICLFLLGENLPAPAKSINARATTLDEFLPAFEFEEFHSIRIRAPREKVAAAIREVTPGEIKLFRTLTWIRRGGLSSKEKILNPSPDEPILSVALRSGFMTLAENGDSEIVLGTFVIAPREWRSKGRPGPDKFKKLAAPGLAIAAINFQVTDLRNGETLLTTETRVHATDAGTRRKFAAYWRVIYPGSALIRIMWLRAIRKRAEQPAGSGPVR